MLNFSQMCAGIEDSVVFRMAGKNDQSEIEGILLCSPSIAGISENYVYLGHPEEADRMLEKWNGECNLQLVIADCRDAGKYSSFARHPAADRLQLVASSLPLAELHNRLFLNLNLYNKWKQRLEAVEAGKGSLRKLLETAVELLDFQLSLYVLSPGFRLIESCVVEISTDRISRRLETSGFLTDSQIRELVDSVSKEKRTVYQLEPIKSGQEQLGYLLVVRDMDRSVPECLIRVLLQHIVMHLDKPDNFIPLEMRQLMNLFEDIFVTIPKDEAAIHRRLQSLPFRLQPFKRLLVVAPAGKEVGNRLLFQIATELRQFFPHHNIAPCEKYVLVLLSGPNFLYRPEFDEKKFQSFLHKYDAYAIASVAVVFIRGMRTAYLQCREMLRMLPELDILGGKRYTLFEDVAGYYRVHLCAISSMDLYGHDKTVYLGHPAVPELMRYDRMHGTDYYNIAYAYINNECSIVKTAEETNYHRNTIINKLEKIKNQVGINLDDKNLRREMLFAFQLIRYAERVQKIKFNLY